MIKNGVIFFDSCCKEGFKFYESYFSKRVQFCESYLKGSILWVLFKKRSNNLNRNFENEGLISSIQKQKEFTSTSHKKVLLLESHNLLGSNSLSPFVKRVQILWVKFWKSGSFSLSHVEKGSTLWFLEKKTNIDKKFNSWSHIKKEWFNSVSHIQKAFNSLRYIFKVQ